MENVVSREIDAYGYGKVAYCFNTQHRDGNPNKSQWTIDTDQEIDVFCCMADHGWGFQDNGWSLFIKEDSSIDYLGFIQSRKAKVFIAKFVVDTNHNAWHGYPADYQVRAQDVPHKDILRKWKDENYLTKAKMRKIMMGQPCKI